QLADAAIEQTGVIPARAGTIRALARRCRDGAVDLNIPTLLDIPGIGPWTAEYIAMRALGEPDAFPCGDLVLRREAGGCTARELDQKAEAWRPWRAYAVMLLWQGGQHEAARAVVARHSDDRAAGGRRRAG